MQENHQRQAADPTDWHTDERNTIASPNPATGKVDSGFSTILNAGSWHRGTYLLRIRTAMGTATKKLVVQQGRQASC